MKWYALVCCIVSPLVLTAAAGAQTSSSTTMKTHKIAVGGDGGWDYLTVDSAGKRLYVSRGNRVIAVDTEAEKVVGELTDTPGVHGVAIVPDLGRGFTSNGGDNTVTVFDLKTLKAVGKVKVGGRPDAIMFDPSSHKVFTFNHGSKDATAVDPSAMSVAGSVQLLGVPEAAVPDLRGNVFVNVMDKNEVVEFDAGNYAVLHRWALSGTRPTGLALDGEHRRLFSVCSGSQSMAILDAGSGKELARLPIGRGADGCAFDPDRGLAFSSNGQDGTLTVVREQEPGKFGVVATIPTQPSARTIALDPSTHRIYLSAATYAPGPDANVGTKAAAGKGGGRRWNIVPGSFVIVVVEE
jgi:YVTN family beta-propeller protein